MLTHPKPKFYDRLKYKDSLYWEISNIICNISFELDKIASIYFGSNFPGLNKKEINKNSKIINITKIIIRRVYFETIEKSLQKVLGCSVVNQKFLVLLRKLFLLHIEKKYIKKQGMV